MEKYCFASLISIKKALYKKKGSESSPQDYISFLGYSGLSNSESPLFSSTLETIVSE